MDNKLTIETLPVEKATNMLRELGMSISKDTLRRGIEQGKFPFGSCVRSESGSPIYYIYRVLFDRWISERAIRCKEEQAG